MRKHYLLLLWLIINIPLWAGTDDDMLINAIEHNQTASQQIPIIPSKQSNWKSHIGMGVGYLPFSYDEFVPMLGFYDERFIFNVVTNSAFVNLVYKNRFMLENRLTVFHYFGHYHSYYNAFYNQTFLGFNIMTLALKDPRHGFYIKVGLGVTNNCACGPDVPFREPGLLVGGIQLDYYLPINNVVNIHISAGNNLISTDLPGINNFTEWQVGVALRLM